MKAYFPTKMYLYGNAIVICICYTSDVEISVGRARLPFTGYYKWQQKEKRIDMWKLIVPFLLIALFIFVGIMLHDARTLWSGVSFFWLLVWSALMIFFIFSEYADQLAANRIITGILIILFILAAGSLIAFPAVLILVFFVEGIRVIRHEGIKPANLLSLVFSVLLCGYLAVWPMVGNLKKNTPGTMLYAIVSFSTVYGLSLLAIYSLSAILNLVHLKKRRNADYIIVLGCGLMGDRVTPLLAARIDKGISLLRYNPEAVLILSGGQGPGEEMTESEAMAKYAIGQGVDETRIIQEQESVTTQENLRFSRKLMEGQHPRVIIVTTAYHVFRALLLARREGIRCVGFGAKTRWYFTLNALLREFIGYLWMTWKRHALVVGVVAGIIMIGNMIG